LLGITDGVAAGGLSFLGSVPLVDFTSVPAAGSITLLGLADILAAGALALLGSAPSPDSTVAPGAGALSLAAPPPPISLLRFTSFVPEPLAGTTTGPCGETLWIYALSWRPAEGDIAFFDLPAGQGIYDWICLVVGAPLDFSVNVKVLAPGGMVLLSCTVPAGRIGPVRVSGAPAAPLSPSFPSALRLSVPAGDSRPMGLLRVVAITYPTFG
jgi:hypothetical protein